mmetsp:Transcript_584/g.1576  ORF Transcript_584/g.1576 Transcript_584/m.1576 type:complete len:274 (+) Transcript_584:530-1351(+)
MTPMSAGVSPALISLATCAITALASPGLALESPSASACSSYPQPAVSTSSSTGSSRAASAAAAPALPPPARSSTSSASVCSATDACAPTRPSYSARDDQSMMRVFMRYCTVSISLHPSPYSPCSRSNSVRPSPCAAAASLTMVGGSCRWSPASTALGALSRPAQHAASSACAASSMTTTSNSSRSRLGCSRPVRVDAMTCAPLTTSFTASSCRPRSSLARRRRSARIWRRSARSKGLSFMSWQLSALISLRQSFASDELSERSTAASRLLSST